MSTNFPWPIKTFHSKVLSSKNAADAAVSDRQDRVPGAGGIVARSVTATHLCVRHTSNARPRNTVVA